MKVLVSLLLITCVWATPVPEVEVGGAPDPEDPYDGSATNPEEAGYYEGDIVLENDGRNAQSERTARRWPNGRMAYYIDPSYSSRVKATILSAMNEIQTKTAAGGKPCITFNQRTSESAYVHIKPLSGCYSSAGRTGRAQTLSIGRGCEGKGTIMHEFIHALGFYHEQSRFDRDKYITIMTQNIVGGRESQFRKMTSSQMQHLTPYDYGSIMHYGKYAFSKNRQPTIQAKSSGITFGQRTSLSAKDVKELQMFYKCTSGGGTGPVITSKPPTGVTTTKPTGNNCVNTYRNSAKCEAWAKAGECTKNPNFMIPNCRKSCKACDGGGGGGSGLTSASCSFDSNLCSFTNDKTADSMDWTRKSGSTPSSKTGPGNSRTGKGYYIYTEASGKYNKLARLISPSLVAGKKYCINFWYHMYGAHMGQLQFTAMQNGKTRYTFARISGNKGNSWRYYSFSINLPLTGAFNVALEGRTGKSYQSDIAVDDLNINTC